MKVALFAPPETVTDEGTEINVWRLESFTTNPSVGAEPVSIRVPVAESGELITVGLIVSFDKRTVGGDKEIAAEATFPVGSFPEMVTFAAANTGPTIKLNVPEVAPEGIMSVVVERLTKVELEANFTLSPDDPAGFDSVTVPVAPLPPINVFGVTERPPICWAVARMGRAMRATAHRICSALGW